MSESFRTWRYNQFECPEGKIFMSDDLPGGDWVDTPAKFKTDEELAAEIKEAEVKLNALNNDAPQPVFTAKKKVTRKKRAVKK